MIEYVRLIVCAAAAWIALAGTATVAAPAPAEVDQDDPRIRVELLAQNLGVPWGMAFVGENRILISERSGRLRLLDLTDLSVTAIDGAPVVVAEGQGGLLDVATGIDDHSDFRPLAADHVGSVSKSLVIKVFE